MFPFDLIKKYRRRFNEECTKCGKPLQVKILNSVTGNNQKIKVYLNNLRVHSCGKVGHPRRYIYPDFGYELTNELFYGDDSPISRTNARLNLASKSKCFSCGETLKERVVANEKFIFDLNLEKNS